MSWGDKAENIFLFLFSAGMGVSLALVVVELFQRGKIWGAFVLSLLSIVCLVGAVLFLTAMTQSEIRGPRIPSQVVTAGLVLLAVAFGGRALWNIYLISELVLRALAKVGEDVLAAGSELLVLTFILAIILSRYQSPVRGIARQRLTTLGIVGGILTLLGGFLAR